MTGRIVGLFEDIVGLIAPTRCAACDEPGAGFCGGCGILVEPLEGDHAAYVFGGPLAAAIRRFKYEARAELAPPLANLLAARATRFAGEVDLVVPVPLHRARRLERGFDQVALLVPPVARALGVPCRPRALDRIRPTPPQVGLGGPAREQNVAGAFAARASLGHKRVLLLDDVRTTGATLRAAAAALRDAGAVMVRAYALAAIAGDERPVSMADRV